MSSYRQFSTNEINELRSVVNDDAFVRQLQILSTAYRQTNDAPIPSPLDSEKVVARLIADTKTLLKGLRDANTNGHPLSLAMKTKGLPGGEILHDARVSLQSLLEGLKKITVIARPGLKKRRGPKGRNDIDQWLMDSVVDILDVNDIETSKYKGGPLAKCINIVRCAAGYPPLEDPCYQLEIRHLEGDPAKAE